ncbi:hypothetical protein E4U53_000101, partial [Claviceps sorghi]
MADLPPPSYQDAVAHSNNTRLPITHHDTLILDGLAIYPSSPPSPFLYQITPSPTAPGPPSYALQKWTFRLPDQHQAPHLPGPATALKSRLHHIYDIHSQTVALPNSLSLRLRPAIRLRGRAGTARSHRE